MALRDEVEAAAAALKLTDQFNDLDYDSEVIMYYTLGQLPQRMQYITTLHLLGTK